MPRITLASGDCRFGGGPADAAATLAIGLAIQPILARLATSELHEEHDERGGRGDPEGDLEERRPVNLMIMGPAGYRFGDYWKLGLAVMAVFFVVAVFLVPVFWPFG